MEPDPTFNPFCIFNRTVKRRFTIRPRDYSKYTEEQLNEHVVCHLRTFLILNVLYFVVKDVCSFLGITPDHVSRTLESIEPCYVRKENVQLSVAPGLGARDPSSHRPLTCTRDVYLITESGIYALIQKSKTTYALDFKQWLNEDVLPTVRATGSYTIPADVQAEVDETNAHLEQEEFGAAIMSDKAKDEEFKSIVVENGELKEQLNELKQKSSTNQEYQANMYQLMQDIHKNVQELREENKKLHRDIPKTWRHNVVKKRGGHVARHVRANFKN